MPLLNEWAKTLKGEGFGLVYDLWEAGSFEEKILAAKLINQLAKNFPHESVEAVRKFSYEIEDWAVCDTLGMQSLKPLAKTHSKEIISLAKELNGAVSFWQRRLSLVLVEVFAKDEKMRRVIDPLVRRLEKDKEYYVKKAVVWIRSSMAKKRKSGK